MSTASAAPSRAQSMLGFPRIASAQSPENHSANVFCISANPVYEELYATASEDQTFRLWSGGRVLQALALSEPMMRVAWSHDGLRLAAGCSDGTICVCRLDLESVKEAQRALQTGVVEGAGRPPLEMECQLGGEEMEEVYGLEFDPSDPSLLLATCGRDVLIYDLELGEAIGRCTRAPADEKAAEEAGLPQRWIEGFLFGLAVAPDGRTVAAACSDGQARFFARDGRSGLRPLPPVPCHPVFNNAVRYSRDGKAVIVTAAKDPDLVVIDPLTLQVTARHPLFPMGAAYVEVSPPTLLGTETSPTTVLTTGEDGVVRVIEALSGKTLSISMGLPAPGWIGLQKGKKPVPRPLLCCAAVLGGRCVVAGGASLFKPADQARSALHFAFNRAWAEWEARQREADKMREMEEAEAAAAAERPRPAPEDRPREEEEGEVGAAQPPPPPPSAPGRRRDAPLMDFSAARRRGGGMMVRGGAAACVDPRCADPNCGPVDPATAKRVKQQSQGGGGSGPGSGNASPRRGGGGGGSAAAAAFAAVAASIADPDLPAPTPPPPGPPAKSSRKGKAAKKSASPPPPPPETPSALETPPDFVCPDPACADPNCGPMPSAGGACADPGCADPGCGVPPEILQDPRVRFAEHTSPLYVWGEADAGRA